MTRLPLRAAWPCGAALLCVLSLTVPAARADEPATGTVVAPRQPAGMAGRLITHYHMHLVPAEGIWFSSTYASEDQLAGAGLPPRYAGRPHAAGSAIVALATPRDFSALHRLRSDEVWHFYRGAPLEMLLLYPDGHGRRLTLGADVLAGELLQVTVPHGVWQGAAPRLTGVDTYSLVGTQLSPAFEYADFAIGYRDELQKTYPAFAAEIARLTRPEFAAMPADRAPGDPSRAPGDAASGKAASGNTVSGNGAPELAATAFSAQQVPAVTAAPGVSLQELVGRVARNAPTSSVSVAAFTLAPGRSSGASFNHQSQEVFLVTGGSGVVHLGERAMPVGPDSTVFIPAGWVHSIEADAGSMLHFYAISAPAFSPEDYESVAPSSGAASAQ